MYLNQCWHKLLRETIKYIGGARLKNIRPVIKKPDANYKSLWVFPKTIEVATIAD